MPDSNNKVSIVGYSESVPPVITVAKGGKKGRAKVSKMIVADPGVALEVELLDLPEGFASTEIVIYFKIGDSASHLPHQAEFRMNAYNGSLDLSEPFVILLPFVDSNYPNETQINLFFQIQIDLNDQNEAPLVQFDFGTNPVNNLSIQSTPLAIKLKVGGVYAEDPFQSPHDLEGNNLHFQKLLIHKLGTVFKLNIPAQDVTTINPMFIYLMKNEDTSSNSHVRLRAVGGEMSLNLEPAFGFLPYFRKVGDTSGVQSVQINVEPFPTDSFTNQNFPYPQDDITPVIQEGELEIVGNIQH